MFDTDSGPNDKGPKRAFAKKAKPAGAAAEYKKPRNSLRIGNGGKRGRSTEKNASRGSLRRRDRSQEKEMRVQAAIERKTVQLPE